ncbi:hypothetical protein SH139x_002533 [Planctomycetaceae bacterium SH139]
MSETVLQFGAGRFLRGFIDRFISELNHGGQQLGSVVVVQSTAGARAELLNQAVDGFTVVVRGREQGELIDREVKVHSISRALVADQQWQQVLDFATSESLGLIVSNATEAGYVLSPSPQPAKAPATLPGKLTAVLAARFAADLPPLTILPCELISRNADRLRELVLEQADQWGLPATFRHYAGDMCYWLNNLVDCMISDLPQDDPRVLSDPLAITAEPYALLAIENPQHVAVPLADHPAVQVVDDLEPYYLRKVRVLNGIHTAMVARYLNSDLATVQAVLEDAAGWRWTRDLLYGEILPTLIGKVDGAVEFVDTTIERFRNPFMAHRLSDIRLNHEQKVIVRLLPTADDFERLFGHRPPLIQNAIETELEPVG